MPRPRQQLRARTPRTAGRISLLLLRAAVHLWGEGGRWLRIAIFIAAGAFFLILGAALTGIPALVALTALAPLVALFLVPARINPMWLLAIAAWPDRIFVNEKRRIPILREGIPLGGDELRRGVRWIFALVAVEVGMAFYYAGVEYLAPRVDRTLVLVTFALFVLVALVAASPTGKIRTRTLGILGILAVILTVIFLFGGKNEFGDKLKAIGNDNNAKAAPTRAASSLSAGESKTYTLLGFDKKVGPVVDMNSLPVGSHVRLWGTRGGTTGAEVCFQDGFCGLISEDFGVRGGPVWLRGPAGDTVTIEVTPPN